MNTTSERAAGPGPMPSAQRSQEEGAQGSAATDESVLIAGGLAPAQKLPGSGIPRAEIESDGAITVPMEVVAQGLKVPVETVLANLRAGLVYQTTERGIGEDAGRFRITFRFRSRQCCLIIDQGGQILSTG